MPRGVYIRTIECNRVHSGKKRSEETKEKIRKTLTGKMCGEKNGNYQGGKEVSCSCGCGRKKYVCPSELKMYKEHFYSIECHGKWDSQNKVGEKASGYKCGEKEVICDSCGEVIKRLPCYIKKHNFCNRKCQHTWQSENMSGEKSPLFGKCKSEESKRKNREWHKENPRKGEENPNWRGGTSFENYPPEFNDRLREQTRKRDNYKCQLCGCLEIECDTLLSIHHIDYDKKNNNLKNLVSLCRGCHSKTNSKEKREYYIKYFTSLLSKIYEK